MPDGVDGDVRSVAAGDGDVAGEALELERAARLQLDDPVDVLGFVLRPRRERQRQNRQDEGRSKEAVSHAFVDEMARPKVA